MNEQLETAAKLASAMPAHMTRRRKKPIRARPSKLALKATPAPALGPEDELLFDPDEEYGEAGPGAGYIVGDVNPPLGVQVGETGEPQMGTQPATPETPPTTQQAASDGGVSDGGDPLVVDLEDEPVRDPEKQGSKGFFSGTMFWVVLVGMLVTCGICALYFMHSKNQSPPSTQPSYGFNSMGGLGGLGGLGTGAVSGLGTGF